jgi:hypothetical protein
MGGARPAQENKEGLAGKPALGSGTNLDGEQSRSAAFSTAQMLVPDCGGTATASVARFVAEIQPVPDLLNAPGNAVGALSENLP